MDNQKIGKFIAKRRKMKNMTQKDLANALDVTSQAISKWETGKGIPDISILQQLSKILSVTIDEIINGEENSSTLNNDNINSNNIIFSCENTISKSYYNKLFKLIQKYFSPQNNVILFTIFCLIIITIISTYALYMIYPSKNIIFITLPIFIILSLILLYMYQGFRIKSLSYYKKFLKENKKNKVNYNYLFYKDKVEISNSQKIITIPYDTISKILMAKNFFIIVYENQYYLIKELDFTTGNISQFYNFFKDKFQPNKKLFSCKKINLKTTIISMCFLLSALIVGIQTCVKFLGVKYYVEYTNDVYSIIFNITTSILLFLGTLLFLFNKKRSILTIITSIVICTSLCVGIVLISPSIKNQTTISYSQDKSNKLILKTDIYTGKTSNYRQLFPLLVIRRDTLPLTTTNPLKIQWLTNDICTVSYISSEDNKTHQYVSTYGQRDNGINYFWSTSSLLNKTYLPINNSPSIWKLKINNEGVTIKNDYKEELYKLEDCMQFGKSVVVLCKNNIPYWTIALDENCKIDYQNLKLNGNIILTPVSMQDTEPIIFSLD